MGLQPMRRVVAGGRATAGFTMMGVIIAVLVVSSSVVVAGMAVANHVSTVSKAAEESQAADVAQAVFEAANAASWQQLAMSSSDPNLSAPQVADLAKDKPLVTLPASQFVDSVPLPAKVTGKQDTYGTLNSNFTVYTSVTWEVQPTVSATTGKTTDGFGTKRVSVLVTWGAKEGQSQTFTMLRTPTVAEAVPTGVTIVSGGGLDVERDVNAPVLAGDRATGVLTATISQAYRWQIQIAKTPDMASSAVLCSGEYSEIKNSVETCTYQWNSTYGLTPSFRLKVWTLDADDSESTADGTKLSPVVTFTGATMPALTGGKVAWNQDQVFWKPAVGLLGAELPGSGATVQTVVKRTVGGTTAPTTLAYSTAGDSKTYTSGQGDSATYQVCTLVNGDSVACTATYGPLYTIKAPSAPTVNGTKTGSSQSDWVANFTWSSTAEGYASGGGVTYDVQRLQADGTTWTTVLAGTKTLSLSSLRPYVIPETGRLQLDVSLRVRVWNDAGFSPWTTATVNIGALPTAPTVYVTALSSAGGGKTQATFVWTTGLNAWGGWYYSLWVNGVFQRDGVIGPQGERAVTYTGTRGQNAVLYTYSTNNFGDSSVSWGSIAMDGSPDTAPALSASPAVGATYGSWGAVPGATSYEAQYYTNGTGATYIDPGCTGGVSWCGSSGTLSVTWGAGINEGDWVAVRLRASNQWGSGPWSNWVATSSAVRTVSVPTVAAWSNVVGGYYSWGATACDAGSVAQYRNYDSQNGMWSTWTQGYYAYQQTIGYGYSGAIHTEARCINVTSGLTSNEARATAGVPWRLLDPSAGWGGNNWKRLEQAIGHTIDGDNFGRATVGVSSASYSNASKRLQAYLNSQDSGLYSDIATDGYWGPGTTKKLQWFLNSRCGTSLAVDGSFGPSTQWNLSACLNPVGGF